MVLSGARIGRWRGRHPACISAIRFAITVSITAISLVTACMFRRDWSVLASRPQTLQGQQSVAEIMVRTGRAKCVPTAGSDGKAILQSCLVRAP
jgi:hypothetical protein